MIRKGIIITKDGFRCLGGPGSGNFGHAGIPGQRGGSAPGGGGGGGSEYISKNPARIEPFNPVRSNAKLESLISSMEEKGYDGPPILTYQDGEIALTGSHRIVAAKEVGIDKIPVLNIKDDTLTEDQWSEVQSARDTESLLRTFQDFKEYEEVSGIDDIIELLEEEVSHEQSEWME